MRLAATLLGGAGFLAGQARAGFQTGPSTLALPAGVASAGALSAQAAADPIATAVRGIAGSIEFHAEGGRLRAKAVQSPTAPIVARVIEAEPGEDGRTRYRVAFIGTVAGEYDLREVLERQDGAPVGGPPLTVRIVSQLPPDYGTDLFSESQPLGLTASRYRAAMIAFIAAWLAVPAVYLAVRAARRKPPPPAVAAVPPPTLADQLRPLVESAIAGTLPVEGRGRLELLLYLHWRERLGLTGSQAEAVMRLRRDPQAGELLRAVEGWLHARRDAGVRPEGDLAALLEPYGSAPAILGVEGIGGRPAQEGRGATSGVEACATSGGRP